MNKNWTYKKLGDICEIYQPQTISTEMLVPDGKYLVYGANGIIGRYDKYNHVGPEVLLTCRGATCGSINVSEPYSWINGNAMVIHPIDDTMFHSLSFLVYLMKSLDYSVVITGAAQPQITRQKLSPLKVAIPPIRIQERIVAELDLLTGVIEKQKAQLKELDNLAQSIFYDMFGDAVTNTRKWPQCTLNKVCVKITDGTHDTPKRINSGIKFITGKHIRPFHIDYDNSDYVSEDVHNSIYARCNPEYGDVLYTNIGAGIGTAARNVVHYEFSMKNVALLKLNPNLYNGTFLEFVLNNPKQKDRIIINNSKGGAQKFLSLKAIAEILVPVPPLQLQQQFAEKIETIEHQKTLIKKSIEETQKLFDYTMDKYFG